MKTEMRTAVNGELTKGAIIRLNKMVSTGMDRDELVRTLPKGTCNMPYSSQDIEYNPKYFKAVRNIDNTCNYIIAI